MSVGVWATAPRSAGVQEYLSPSRHHHSDVEPLDAQQPPRREARMTPFDVGRRSPEPKVALSSPGDAKVTRCGVLRLSLPLLQRLARAVSFEDSGLKVVSLLERPFSRRISMSLPRGKCFARQSKYCRSP